MDSQGLRIQNELLSSVIDENSSNLISKYFMKDKSSLNIADEQNTFLENKSESQTTPLEKVQKFFRKNIKLRNATIKKNFWERNLNSSDQANPSNTSSTILLKIIDLIPNIESTQGLQLCISNYISNDNYGEFFGKVISEVSENNNTNDNAKTETLNFIDNNSHDYNLLMNAKSKDNKKSHKMNIYKLILCAYKRIKAFKSNQEGEFITKFLSFYKSGNNDKKPKDIIGKIYYVFPNINFELSKIKNISLSSKFKLNKLLISKHTTHIALSPKGVPLKSGFITMSSEKRIITLTDDTNNKSNLKSSQSLKHIIFGIWINLKEEEISSVHSTKELEGIVKKNSMMIYQKCLEYIMSSSKIETIYSPSPDEGVFLLLLFFKGSQLHYEVKVIPNEEDKIISSKSNNNNKGIADCDEILSPFKNQWLVLRKMFSLMKDKMAFNIKEIASNSKISTMSHYVNILHGIEKSDSQMMYSRNVTNTITNGNGNIAKYDDSLSPIKKNYSNLINDPLKELFDPPGIKEEGDNNKKMYRINVNMNMRMNSAQRLKFNDIDLDDDNEEEYKYPYGQPNEMEYPQMQKEKTNGNINNFIPQYPKMLPSTNHNHKEFEPTKSVKNDPKVFSNIFNNNNNTKPIQTNINDQNQIQPKIPNMNIQNLYNQIPNNNHYFAQTQSQSQIQTQCNAQTQTQKCDEGSQTIVNQLSSNSNNNEDNQNSQNANSQNIQIQSLINTINDQSQSMQLLQNKVVELEALLEKITSMLKERETTCICQGKNRPMPTEIQQQSPQIQQQSPQNEEEFELSDDKISESLKNSKSDSFAHKNKSNHNLSSLNLSTNNNEKTIEVPQIKYNIMTCLSNDNDNETESDIHQY